MSKRVRHEIVLVGAGLVGSLLSIYLAKRGLKVRVFERRTDMRTQARAEGRSINLAISCRGITALEQLGLTKDVLKEAVPMRGRMIHSTKGDLTFQRYGLDDTQCINSISRAGLNRFLLERAERDYGVTFVFQHRLTEANLETGELEFLDEARNAPVGVKADVILGTDGSASVLRKALQATPQFSFQEIDPKTAYKELVILDDGGRHRMEKHALHIWPRGRFMLIALPNFDGTFTCTLFLPTAGVNSFEQLKNAQAVREFFGREFPDAVPLLHDLEGTFFANPTGALSMIKCFPWSSPKKNALILGDAAHAIIPFFGQGMNCGFEDVMTLDRLVGEHGTPGKVNWPAVFSAFEKDRKPRADAIADLSSENFEEMRDHVGSAEFLMQKQVEKILEENFPGQYVSRYSMVSFSLIPYDKAFRIGEVQKGILQDLCRGLRAAKDVDLTRAGSLVKTRLAPLMG